MNNETSFLPVDFLTSIDPRGGAKVKVYWWFKVAGTDDITRLVQSVQQNHVRIGNSL